MEDSSKHICSEASSSPTLDKPDSPLSSPSANKPDSPPSSSSSCDATTSSNSGQTADKEEILDEDLWASFADTCNIAKDVMNTENVDSSRKTDDVVHSYLVSLCKWQMKHHVSDVSLEELLKLNKKLLPDSMLAEQIPDSLFRLYKYLDIDCEDFEKYVVCPQCTKIYRYGEIVVTNNGLTKVSKCSNVRFETGKLRHQCNAELVKEVKTKSEKKYVPLKYYCYKSVVNSLEELLKRPGIFDKCKAWCDRNVPTDTYSDVYNGKIWREFMKQQGQSNGFFCRENDTFGFSLNIDWFQPYKNKSDVSIGVMYLVLLNLPREERYKRENWIVLGVIPNLKKEPSSLEYFLNPFVDELKVLFNGVKLDVAGKPDGIKIRAALILVTCDIPAARKTCGHLGHSAKLGCSKCLKRFPGTPGNMDYSGTDVNYWPRKSVQGHRAAVKRMKLKAKSMTRAKQMESECGYRYTPLLDLPYFDTVQFCTIDAMHNLMTGIGKHVCGRIWIQKLDLLSPKDLEKIDEKLEKMTSVSENQWRPRGFASNWASWTAYEYMSWILTYSLYALEGILEEKHLSVWHIFVRACCHLIQPTVSKIDIEEGHRLLVQFVKEVQNVYGLSCITPNMHMCMHIKEDMYNYGSLYATWLFPYERFNFELGSTKTNRRSIEVQLMKSVEKYKQLVSLTATEGDKTVTKFRSLWPVICPLGEVDACQSYWNDLNGIVLTRGSSIALGYHKHHHLLQCYRSMYPNRNISPDDVLSVCKSYSFLHMSNTKYASTSYSLSSKQYRGVMAAWTDEDGRICFDAEVRPCKIVRFVKHSLHDVRTDSYVEHVFAIVRWYKRYDDRCPYLSPLSVWHSKQTVSSGPSSFLPVQRILSKFVWAEHNANRLVISPVPARVML